MSPPITDLPLYISADILWIHSPLIIYSEKQSLPLEFVSHAPEIKPPGGSPDIIFQKILFQRICMGRQYSHTPVRQWMDRRKDD